MSTDSRPTSSPWGPIQSIETLDKGIFLVSTASHGGIMVNPNLTHLKDVFALVPSHQTRSTSWKYFEEDCDANLIIMEHRLQDKKDLFPGVTHESLVKSLSRWHPEYLIHKGIEPDKDNYKRWQDDMERDRRRNACDPELIIAKSRLPNGDGSKLIISTADDKTYLVHSLSDNSTATELSNYEIIKDLTGVWIRGYAEYVRSIPEEVLKALCEHLNMTPEEIKKEKTSKSYVRIVLDESLEHDLEYVKSDEEGDRTIASVHLENWPPLYKIFEQLATKK